MEKGNAENVYRILTEMRFSLKCDFKLDFDLKTFMIENFYGRDLMHF